MDRQRLVTLGAVEQADEHRFVVDDEHRHPPHLMAVGVARVLVGDGGERTSRIDLGEHPVGIESAAGDDGRQSIAAAEIASARVLELVQGVVHVDECVRLIVAHGDPHLQSEDPRVGLGGVPHVRHSLLDVRLTEAERQELDVPVGAGAEPGDDVVVGDATVGAAVVPGESESACHVVILPESTANR